MGHVEHGASTVLGDQPRASCSWQIVNLTVATEPEALPCLLTSLWSSSFLRPWGSAGSPRERGGERKKDTGNDEDRNRKESLLPNHLVCSRRGPLLDFASVSTGGLMVEIILVFSQSAIQEGRERDGEGKKRRRRRKRGRRRRELWWQGML